MHQNGFVERNENGAVSEVSDNIDQVRELLFGEQKRRTEAQIEEVNQRIAGLDQKLDRIREELIDKVTLSADTASASQREVVRSIAEAIKTLGEQIENLASVQSNDRNHADTES
jgi:hypothetical protein